MKQPSFSAYLFGNTASMLAVAACTLYLGFKALTGSGSGWLAIGMLMAAVYCASRNRQLTAYRAWKRDWEGMGDEGGPPQPNTWLRYALGIPAWLLGAWMVEAAGKQMSWVAGLFWLASLAGFAIVGFRIFPKRWRRRKLAVQPSVAHCLATPLHSLPVASAYDRLPDYCLHLLKIDA